MNQHLGISLDPLIKLLICRRGIVDGDLVADNEAGLRLAGDDQVAEIPVVVLDVALASRQGEALLEELAEGHGDLAFAGELVGRTRVGWNVELVGRGG